MGRALRRRAERQQRLKLKQDWWDELPPELRLPSMEELERLSRPEPPVAAAEPTRPGQGAIAGKGGR